MINIPPLNTKLPISVDVQDDVSNGGIALTESYVYPKKVIHSLPPQLIEAINNLILNQIEIAANIDKILKSRIGKAIVNLEKGMENDEKNL